MMCRCYKLITRPQLVHIGTEQVLGRDYKISQEMRPMDLAPLFDDVWTGSQVGRVI